MKRMGEFMCALHLLEGRFHVESQQTELMDRFHISNRPPPEREKVTRNKTEPKSTRLDSNHTRGRQRSRAEMEWTKTSFRVVNSVELFSFSKSKLETLSFRALEDIFHLAGIKRPRLGHFAHSSPSLEDFSLACNDEPHLKIIQRVNEKQLNSKWRS